MGGCLASIRIVFAILVKLRDILVKVVSWVMFLTLFLSMIIICLARLEVVNIANVVSSHIATVKRPYGCLNLL